MPNLTSTRSVIVADDQIRAVLMNASQLVSYDFFKDSLLSSGYLSNGMPLHILSSALSGTVATTICAPADVVKSRVMNASGNEGPVKLLVDSFKKEGPRFLFKGWLPAWSESLYTLLLHIKGV
jgi:dicarboxylate transporter 10